MNSEYENTENTENTDWPFPFIFFIERIMILCIIRWPVAAGSEIALRLLAPETFLPATPETSWPGQLNHVEHSRYL